MTESLPAAKINFMRLTREELSTKVAQLVSEKSRVVFWKATPRYYEGKAESFHLFQGKIHLTLSGCNLHLRLTGEKICMNFVVNETDYFLSGRVVTQLEEGLQIVFELDEHCFQVEKRSKGRVVAYPIYEIYAYLKYQKGTLDNVVFLDKKGREEHNFFSAIEDLKKNKWKAEHGELSLGDQEDLIGFRVEDLSFSGLSFFATGEEKQQILDVLGDKKFELVVNFEGQIFNLEEASIVYKIHYIHAQCAGVPMYKVGIVFKPNINFRKKVESQVGENFELIDFQKKFEEFIKNE